MPGIIVSDTSCLILLDKLGRIGLLKSLFGRITITKIVAEEFGNVLPEFVDIENPKNKNYQKILESFLDPGEASAIALALEKEECLLIIDEFKGRREARQLGLNYTGTLGILIVAKEKGLINSVTEIIKEIGKTDFRINEKLINEVKRKSGE
jgi:predicted nucleic acid-binding protein